MYESALIVDESMKEVGKISARKITESRYKLFVVENDEEKYGLCDVEGKMLIPFTCKNIFIKTPSLIGVSLTSRYAFCDIYGKPLTEYIYGNASSTIDTEHYFIISDNYSNYGVMSADGQIVTECKFEKIGAFAEGLAVAKSHKACYLIDLYGESEPIGNAVLQG